MTQGNPAWGTPTQETSQWAKKPIRDAEAEQRKYDEVELRKATYTKKSLWGRETKYNKDGREIKDPSRKKSWWGDGIF